MGKIYNIFSTSENSPKDFSLEAANELVPLLRRYTDEAIQETQKVALKMEYLGKETPQFKTLSKAHDQSIIRWAERVHRLGGLAKGLWTVDFDNGKGFLCWSHPEDKIEHFHSYDGSFKTRTKLGEQAIETKKPAKGSSTGTSRGDAKGSSKGSTPTPPQPQPGV